MAELPLTTRFPGVSTLGYGCMGLGGGWDATPYDEADRARGFAALDAALEAGITLFDHADIYRHGKAERLFGEWLAANPELRQSLVIQSKGGIRLGTEGAPQHYDLSAGHIEACVNASLERLGIEQLDLWLLHRPDPLWEPAEIADIFTRLQAAGKVRHFGVSNMHLHQLALLESHWQQPLAVNQLELSLGHRGWLESDIAFNTGHSSDTAGTLDYCRRHGIQVQAWGSLAGGRFSGRPQPGDETAADLVAEMAASREVSPEALVLAWLLRHPAGIQPLLGTTDPARIAACAQAHTVELGRIDWYRLYTAARGDALP